MPQGLQVFDSSGILKFDSSDYLARFVGSVESGVTAGSVSFTNFNVMGGFAIVLPPFTGNTWWRNIPRVTILTDGFSWDWQWPDNRSAATIIYGVRL